MNLDRFPFIKACSQAEDWLEMNSNLGLAKNTLLAYARGIEEFLHFCETETLAVTEIRRSEVAAYVRDMLDRPRRNMALGLSNATIQQRLTAVRLFFDFLIDEKICERNPVGRGRYAAGYGATGAHRGLIPRCRELPWIPNDEQWETIIRRVRLKSIRDRLMFLLAYDCALRREELCSLTTSDVDPGLRTIRIRADTTKNRFARILPYSRETSVLLQQYLVERRKLTLTRGPLFLSISNRNRTQAISIWTWSKTILRVAREAGVEGFSTHTLRHLCLTDFARAGWEIHEIAEFAGHRSIQSTLRYIHLSGRELAAKLASSMSSIHALRVTGAANLMH